jgi:hypothetical protein
VLKVTIAEHAIRIGERFAVSFQRTLRIPDDGRTYPLPPGLGAFPVLKVANHTKRVPLIWREQGGAFIPMYQREALWLGFRAASWKPSAVKIAVGRVNAISGQPHDDVLRDDPQDYVVCPEQPWLDGINTAQGTIRQFVAMPLRLGYTVEASVSGRESFGGIQISVFDPKPGRFPDKPPIESTPHVGIGKGPQRASPVAQPMGVGAGGKMKQRIYPDPYGIDTWTGIEPPRTPIDAKTYTEHRLPWFDLYDESKGDVAPSDDLAAVKTVAAQDTERGVAVPDDASVDIAESQVKTLKTDEIVTRKGSSSSPYLSEHAPEHTGDNHGPTSIGRRPKKERDDVQDP